MNDRTLKLARGKGLGGSSAINFMATVFPSRASIDIWGKLGNDGWNWENLEPYYQKAVKRHAPSPDVCKISDTNAWGFDESTHGTGPLQISYSEGLGPVNSAWMDALTSLNFAPSNADPTSGSVVGAFQCMSTFDPATKTRSYAATAYYGKEMRERSNLTVITNTIVQKINLEGQSVGVIATGVQLQTNEGCIRTVKARREVVLAAGAVQSPQILELSGIGSSKLLKKLEIPVVIDLPGVGENLQDHAMVCQSYQVRDGISSIDMFRDPALIQQATKEYNETRGGPLGTQTASVSYMPLVDSEGRMSTEAKKTLLKEYIPDKSGQTALLKEMVTQDDTPAFSWMIHSGQVNAEVANAAYFGQYLAPLKSDNYISVLNALAHPFSRGTCHVNCSDINVAPTIDAGYLSHPADLQIMARSAMFANKLMRSGPMSKVVLHGGAQIPGIVPDTLENAKEAVRQGIISNMHLCGTCAMKPLDQGGVLNDCLLVYGTRNLRVVDASIFPTIPLGNIQTTVYAVAEKSADLIRAAR